MGSMFDYLWIFHALYSRCRMAHFCNILPTGCKLMLNPPSCKGRSKIDPTPPSVDRFARFFCGWERRGGPSNRPLAQRFANLVESKDSTATCRFSFPLCKMCFAFPPGPIVRDPPSFPRPGGHVRRVLSRTRGYVGLLASGRSDGATTTITVGGDNFVGAIPHILRSYTSL